MIFRKKTYFSICFVFLFLFVSANLFCDIPKTLYGIWEGKDRYVFFENTEGNDRISVVLKSYYGWYLDRALEDPSYKEKYPRDRNIAVPKEVSAASVSFIPLTVPESENEAYYYEDSDSMVFELIIGYGKKEIKNLPVALIDDKIYLEFWTKDLLHPGFWRGNARSKGILVSNQNENENLYSWYIDPDAKEVFKIRYWKSNMDYDDTLEASLKSILNPETEYLIPKHIFSSGNLYVCVPGRRFYVRTIDKNQKVSAFDGRKVIYNKQNTVCVPEEEIYLKKLMDKKSLDSLIEIVNQQNSRKKPERKPLFPPEEIDYHWDLIDLLEKDNLIIQEVRKRQAEFGVRGKEFGR